MIASKLAGFLAGAAGFWMAAHTRAMRQSAWAPSSAEPERFGQLWARSTGHGSDDAVVLLHGLVSTGDVFGAAYDRLALTHHLVRPDLLGFGHSMSNKRTEFGRQDHLDALDEMADKSGLFDSHRWTLGAHSMGVSVALSWAARHHDRVVRVVGWGAPIYPTTADARAHIAGSTMTRLFALDNDMAARACALSCRHRAAASWLSVAAEPSLPVSIARAAPLHTWPAYRDSMRSFVLDADWSDLVATCDRHDIAVRFVWGNSDEIGDRTYSEQLVSKTRHASVTVLEYGDHHLPLTHSTCCAAQLDREAKS